MIDCEHALDDYVTCTWECQVLRELQLNEEEYNNYGYDF